jgi:hypothetical protein
MKTILQPALVNFLKHPLLFILACWVIFCFEILLFQPLPVVMQNSPAYSPRLSLDYGGSLANISRSSTAPSLLSYASKHPIKDNKEGDSQSSQSGEYVVTAILPVTLDSLQSLPQQLGTLLQQRLHLHEILLLCQPEHQAQTRKVLFSILSEEADDHQAEISIFNWSSHLQEGAALIHAAQRIDISPDRILLLGTDSLESYGSGTLAMLTGRFATPLPVGPRGFNIHDGDISCLSANSSPNVASFVVPPFSVAPFLIPPHDLSLDSVYDIWFSLGEHISRARHEGVGGIVIDFDKNSSWCSSDQNDSSNSQRRISPTPEVEAAHTSGIFVVILPSLDDLSLFASLVCRLWSSGHDVRILLTDPNISAGVKLSSLIPQQSSCAPGVESLHSINSPAELDAWLETLSVVPDVILTIPSIFLSYKDSPSYTIINIPREDLAYCDWMSTLSLEAWKS